MGRNGVYGDQITLNGIAALYRIKITVVATLGPDAQVSINEGEGNLECVLGHFAEGNGEHYLNLERDFEPETDNEIVEFVVTPSIDVVTSPVDVFTSPVDVVTPLIDVIAPPVEVATLPSIGTNFQMKFG